MLRSGKAVLGQPRLAKGSVGLGGDPWVSGRGQTAVLWPPVLGRKTAHSADSSAWGWVGTRGLTHTCGEGVSVGQTHPAAPGGGGWGWGRRFSAPHGPISSARAV